MNVRKLALRLVLVVLVGALVVEGCFRFVLFADAADGTKLARALRQPWRFASTHEQLFWYLQDRFVPDERRGSVPNYDPELGWLGSTLTAERASVDEPRIGDRQLVLLYGDSYAACNTLAGDCFQGLLDDCELGRRVGLLNLGVGGYGLDQITLLLEATLERYVARDPIVVVAILLDDDLDRCLLDFRCWPKPRLRLEGGELVAGGPVAPSIEEHWRRGTPAPPSYAWRFFERARETGFEQVGPPEETAEYRREVAELTSALLRRTEKRLRDARLRHFYLLFEYRDSIKDPRLTAWRRRCVTETLDELEAPWIETKPTMLAAAAETPHPIDDFFGTVGRNAGHFNVLGNQLAFRALLDGLARFGGLEVAPENYQWLATLDGTPHPHAERARAVSGKARFAFARGAELPEDRLTITCDAQGHAEVRWNLLERSRSLRTKAMLASATPQNTAEAPGTDRPRSAARLRWSADGVQLAKQILTRDAPKSVFQLDLAGRRELVLTVDIEPGSDTVVQLDSLEFD